MMGIDSRAARPFEIMFNNAPLQYFPRDSTMYVFLRHNIGVSYTLEGIIVSGR